MEIALSHYCDEHCVITPLIEPDEAVRAERGGRGPQNFEETYWPTLGKTTKGTFYNHISAREARALIPKAVWRHYRKVAIHRDPFDQAVSRYHWELHRLGPEKAGRDFTEFVERKTKYLRQNLRIAPLKGKFRLDHYIRYDELEQGLERLGLEGVAERMRTISTKAGHRPAEQTKEAVFRNHPQAARRIAEVCAEEIDYFGFRQPV